MYSTVQIAGRERRLLGRAARALVINTIARLGFPSFGAWRVFFCRESEAVCVAVCGGCCGCSAFVSVFAWALPNFDTPWAIYDKSSFLFTFTAMAKENKTCPESHLRLLGKAKKKGKTARWSVTGISILYTIMVRAAYLMKISLFLRYISSHHAQLSVST